MRRVWGRRGEEKADACDRSGGEMRGSKTMRWERETTAGKRGKQPTTENMRSRHQPPSSLPPPIYWKDQEAERGRTGP